MLYAILPKASSYQNQILSDRAPEPIGAVNMMVAGVGGSVVGGVVGHVLGGAHETNFHRASLIGSITDAVVLLVIVGVICRRLLSE